MSCVCHPGFLAPISYNASHATPISLRNEGENQRNPQLLNLTVELKDRPKSCLDKFEKGFHYIELTAVVSELVHSIFKVIHDVFQGVINGTVKLMGYLAALVKGSHFLSHLLECFGIGEDIIDMARGRFFLLKDRTDAETGQVIKRDLLYTAARVFLFASKLLAPVAFIFSLGLFNPGPLGTVVTVSAATLGLFGLGLMSIWLIRKSFFTQVTKEEKSWYKSSLLDKASGLAHEGLNFAKLIFNLIFPVSQTVGIVIQVAKYIFSSVTVISGAVHAGCSLHHLLAKQPKKVTITCSLEANDIVERATEIVQRQLSARQRSSGLPPPVVTCRPPQRQPNLDDIDTEVEEVG